MENEVFSGVILESEVLDIVTGGAEYLKKLNKTHNRNRSVARISRDRIMKFPVLMSSEIPDNDKVVIAKALEKQYSAFVLLALSSRMNYRSTDATDASDVIRGIHSNDGTPKLHDYLIDLQTLGDKLDMESTMPTSYAVTKDDMEAIWYSTEESLNTSNLNSMYRPNESAISKMEKTLSGKFKVAVATEDVDDMVDGYLNNEPSDATHSSLNISVNRETRVEFDADNKKTGETTILKTQQNPVRLNELRGSLPAITEIRSMTSLEPTLVNATVFIDGRARVFTVAVKAMVRDVPSKVMEYNLIRSLQDSHLASFLIKWSKGEVKFFRDLIFDIQNAREDAMSLKDGTNWVGALRRRKQASRAFVGSSTNVSPVTTLVITDTEVERVKAETGMDLMRPNIARRLLNEKFLLGLVIYNTQSQVVHTMLDGDGTDEGFFVTTIRGLRGGNDNANALTSDDLAKLLGRRA